MADREPPDEPDDRPASAGAADRPNDRGGRFRRLGRRIMGDAEGEGQTREGRTILGDAKEVFGAVLEGGDKAKSEVVRAVAREVRNYLEELGLKDDLKNLATNYSLELHASVNLRRLAESEKAPREEKRDDKAAARDEKGRSEKGE
ncbi:MAG: hypothetical protein Q8P41_11420 [Pseudomonadota bacterium]|nr:hypothetical protein [Pseudomonadota bacterium]